MLAHYWNRHIHELKICVSTINPLNAELNAICHLLALLGTHHIFHVSGLKVKLLISQNMIIRRTRMHVFHLNYGKGTCKLLRMMKFG